MEQNINWEYRVIKCTSRELDEKKLNELGKEGWELICINMFPDNGRDDVLLGTDILAYFKRKIIN
jgi:hypothetical protein